MVVLEKMRKCGCQFLRRISDFLFLWDVAVAAALYLGQANVTDRPIGQWLWLYIFIIALVLDFFVLLLEKGKCSN